MLFEEIIPKTASFLDENQTRSLSEIVQILHKNGIIDDYAKKRYKCAPYRFS